MMFLLINKTTGEFSSYDERPITTNQKLPIGFINPDWIIARNTFLDADNNSDCELLAKLVLLIGDTYKEQENEIANLSREQIVKILSLYEDCKVCSYHQMSALIDILIVHLKRKNKELKDFCNETYSHP